MNESRARRGLRFAPSLVSGGVTTVILLTIYLATAAPDLTFWDAAELTTAAQTLGIPHAPGTPLWVLLGHIASIVFHNAGPARAITMLSVVSSALAGGVGAAMAQRWLGARGAVAAAVSAGVMMSVWSNATETEVYAVSLLASIVLIAAGERAGRHDASDEQRGRWRALMVFISALAVPLHLSLLVALPAAIVFAWRGARPRARDVFGWAALFTLGMSAVAVLPMLSARHPLLDSGRPISFGALLDVLQRKQFAVASLWPRMAPLWLQIGNVFEWADWQVAFGLHADPTPSWSRTPLSIAWAWLGVLGLHALWQHEKRVGRAMLVLLLSGTVGVAVWLNLRAGPSYGAGVLADGTLHEARERDYFFVLGFWSWGICAGAGMTHIARQFTKRLPVLISILPYALAVVPILANRPVMDRTLEPLATLPRTVARQLLDAVPMHGVLYTAGDNDTFPLWYLQQVEMYRPDVLVITVPLLGARWYREQLVRRDGLLPNAAVAAWLGLGSTLHSTSLRAGLGKRPIRVSVLLSASDRRLIDPTSGWVLEGLVYAPTLALQPGAVGLSLAALVKASDQLPVSSLVPLAPGADPAAAQMQALLRCTQVRALTDTLLVGTCNGS